MGRKVGKFINPETGEQDWLDVSTVKTLILAPIKIQKFDGQRRDSSIVEFKFDNIDMLNVITITAEHEHQGKIIKSEAQQVDELEFTECLANAVYSDQTLDSEKLIIELKEAALEDLKIRLLQEGFLTAGLEMYGAGYILSKKIRVITIDKMKIEFENPNEPVINSNGAQVVLDKCVGNISLRNLIEPEIVFYSMGMEFRISDFELISDKEDRIKTYVLHAKYINFSHAQEDLIFSSFDVDLENEDSVDHFISLRREKLDDYLNVDNTLDDRFADIF